MMATCLSDAKGSADASGVASEAMMELKAIVSSLEQQLTKFKS